MKIGDIKNGKVIKIYKNGAVIEFDNKETGFLHISKIKNQYIPDINKELTMGQRVKVKVLYTKENNVYLKLIHEKNEITHFEKKEKKDTKKTFEQKLSDFLKESKEKQMDIKRGQERRRSKRDYEKMKKRTRKK